MAQWLRVCLLMQGTRVRALAWEDPTCRGAAGPVSHNCWACASGACAPQRERPAHRDEEWPPLATTGESPRAETKTQHSQNQSINQSIKHTHLIQDPQLKKKKKKKKRNLLFYSSIGQKSDMGLTGLKSGCQQGCVLSGSLREDSISLLFPSSSSFFVCAFSTFYKPLRS